MNTMDMLISNIIGAMRLWLAWSVIIWFVYIFLNIFTNIVMIVSIHICLCMGKWDMFKLSGTYSDITQSVNMSNTTGVL
jgi:hypothetical protein